MYKHPKPERQDAARASRLAQDACEAFAKLALHLHRKLIKGKQPPPEEPPDAQRKRAAA